MVQQTARKKHVYYSVSHMQDRMRLNMEETKTTAGTQTWEEREEHAQEREPEHREQENDARERQTREEREEKSETAKSSETQSFETVKGSETSESPEAESSETSESSETATTEYSTSEEETSSKREKQSEGETETETKQQKTETGADSGREYGGDAYTEAMQEFYDALTSDVSPQEYYAEMLGYADSINHTCTMVFNLCFAILLCAGIIAGSVIAHAFWSKFR